VYVIHSCTFHPYVNFLRSAYRSKASWNKPVNIPVGRLDISYGVRDETVTLRYCIIMVRMMINIYIVSDKVDELLLRMAKTWLLYIGVKAPDSSKLLLFFILFHLN